MTNHVHLLVTPKSTSSAGELLKRLGNGMFNISTERIEERVAYEKEDIDPA